MPENNQSKESVKFKSTENNQSKGLYSNQQKNNQSGVSIIFK